MSVWESERRIEATAPSPGRETLLPVTRASVAWGIAWVFVVLAAAILYVASLHNFQIGTYGDDAYYIVTARSLAAGKGYVLGTLLGAPPMLRLPPGYPLVLSIVARLFPSSLAPMRWPSLLFTLASLPLWMLVLRRRLPLGWCLLVLGATIANPLVVASATNVMSEAMTFVLIPALILLVENSPSLGASSRLTPVASAAAIVATLIALHFARSIMVAFVGATFLYFVLNRQVRLAFVIAILAGIPFVAWMGYTLLGPSRIDAYASTATGTPSDASTNGSVAMASAYGGDVLGENPTSGNTNGSERVIGALNRRWALASLFLPDALGVSFVDLGHPGAITRLLEATGLHWLPTVVSSGWTWLMLAGLVGGLLAGGRWRRHFAELAALVYLASLLVWNFPAARLVEPIVPLVYLGLFSGVALVIGRLLPSGRISRGRFLAAGAIVGLLLLINLRIDSTELRRPARTVIPDISIGSSWLAAQSPAGSVVLTDDGIKHSLYVPRLIAPLPTASRDDGSYLAAMAAARVNYVLIAPRLYATRYAYSYSPGTTRMKEIAAEHPELFRLVYTSPSGQEMIYQFGSVPAG